MFEIATEMRATEMREVAKLAADEAMESLFSSIWADSFDEELLRQMLEALIYPMIREARPLSLPHPNARALEGDDEAEN